MDSLRFIDRVAASGQTAGVAPAMPRSHPSAAPTRPTDQWQPSVRPAAASAGATFLQRLQALGHGFVDRVSGAVRSGPSTGTAPAWRQAGDAIARIAESRGYRRGQVIQDSQVVGAMLDQAAQLYGVPAHWLHALAGRESGGAHWDSAGRVKERAAVGLLQIERSAYPELVRGGEANARSNAYDLANNIAIGASLLRSQLDRMVRASGYRGNDAWRDLGPLVEFTYSAGSGALRGAQQIARERGLDPWNWQHLLLGRSWQGGGQSALRIPQGWLTSSPMGTMIERIHANRQRDGRTNYPRAWTDAGSVRRFDFDGDGQAHKVERMLARTLHMVLGQPDPRPA